MELVVEKLMSSPVSPEEGPVGVSGVLTVCVLTVTLFPSDQSDSTSVLLAHRAWAFTV